MQDQESCIISVRNWIRVSREEWANGVDDDASVWGQSQGQRQDIEFGGGVVVVVEQAYSQGDIEMIDV